MGENPPKPSPANSDNEFVADFRNLSVSHQPQQQQQSVAQGGPNDFQTLAMGKSTQEQKNDILKMFDNNPSMGHFHHPHHGMGVPAMGGMGMGYAVPAVGMGVPMGVGAPVGVMMGAVPPHGVGVNMVPAPIMGMGQNYGVYPQPVRAPMMAMGGVGVGMGMPGMVHHQQQQQAYFR
eukprot:c10167_g1_i2.p2 GENE.c10167_g1_i2~~c10167_g1_i2.p2  ORF type:complete len:177 (-),score=20.11 c10167_g1_i2:57-587(-)